MSLSWDTNGLIIKGELPTLNEEINGAKKHWSYYAKKKKEWTNLVAWQAKKMAKIKEYPITFEINWYMKNKKKDPDNVAFAKKYIFDGLVTAGVLENDGSKQITGWTEVISLDRDNPRVEVFIF